MSAYGFKDRNDIIDNDKIEIPLGSDVEVTAGPADNGSYPSTHIPFESEVYSYHSSNGLITGEGLEGGFVSNNQKLNDSLYGNDS